MTANITDVVFDDGAEIELVIGSSSAVIQVLALDFQEHGIVYEHEVSVLGVPERRRVFRPYSASFTLTQKL